jgi:hypothetical protein
MTLDHAALTAIWTGYIFYGSFLKDRRLEHFIGEPYKAYQQRVPGYPLLPAGPLGRHRPAADIAAGDELPALGRSEELVALASTSPSEAA